MSYYQLFLDYMSNENALEKQSKCYLSKTECALCSDEFFEDPHGMFIISETCKDMRSDHRYYFPICQLVCKECYYKLEDRIYEDVRPDLSNYDIPEWSRVKMFFTNCHVRPCGLCPIQYLEEAEDLLNFIGERTESWDEYNEISFGELEEELDNQ